MTTKLNPTEPTAASPVGRGCVLPLRHALLLSGGVDSAVALHLLCEQGIRPDLFYIQIGQQGAETTCTAEEDWDMATLTARRYGLRLEKVNLQQAYHERVTAYAVDRIRRGLTPNPDVMCNRLIKFGAFEEVAGHAYDRIATGHYAQIINTPDGERWLGPSPDKVKDQSDFLSQLTSAQLRKLCLPLGRLIKKEVRALAAEWHLPSAHRRDSQGICFLGKINYARYLSGLLGERTGEVVEKETGKVIGLHHGHWFYTIGQRKGLGLGGGPWFVADKDVAANRVYVTHGQCTGGIYGQEITLIDFHFITGNPWTRLLEYATKEANVEVLFKIRHTEEPQRGVARFAPDRRVEITAAKPVQGIAPGQFGVLYTADGRICAGSGEIRTP